MLSFGAVIRIDYFIELYNVRMPNDLKNMNLSGDSFYVRLLHNLVFIEHLYCHLSKSTQEYICFQLLKTNPAMNCNLSTFYLVSMCVPNLTFPNVPSPMSAPSKKY